MCFKLVQAFYVLHEENDLAHLDIKGDNVVLTEELELAIIDFGYTCPAWDPNVDPCVGTAIYNPPEIELARQ